MPNFKEIFGNTLDAECCEGYYDGRRMNNPEPDPNRHPAYIHGFRNGRDDLICSKGLQQFPSRTAQKTREDWAFIEASLKD